MMGLIARKQVPYRRVLDIEKAESMYGRQDSRESARGSEDEDCAQILFFRFFLGNSQAAASDRLFLCLVLVSY